MDISVFRAFVASLGMDTAYISSQKFDLLTIKTMIQKFGSLFVSYNVEAINIWWHDVVLYEANVDALGVGLYQVMDPANGASYRIFRKPDFFPAGADRDLIIGWRVHGRAGIAH